MARRDHLSDALVASLPTAAKQYYVWDKRTSGFGVRIGATGTRSFVGKINHPGRRSKWLTMLSKTVESARWEYAQALGEDPEARNRWRGHEADRFPRVSK